jgi:DNA-binding NtrC family response regulator
MSAEQKTQVLILDDEPIVCKRLHPALEKAGYEVEAFTKSSEAMERIKTKEFDVVITDLKMEGLDGMAFLTEVKKRAQATEVIVITGFATMETARESYQKGVFDFIAKPFKLGEIQEVVRKAAEKRRAAQNA